MSSGWKRSPSTATRTPRPPTSGPPTSRSGWGRRRRPRATSGPMRSSRPPSPRARRPFTRATASSPSGPRSPRRSRWLGSSSSVRTTGRSRPSATSWRRAAWRQRPGSRSSRGVSSRSAWTAPTSWRRSPPTRHGSDSRSSSRRRPAGEAGGCAAWSGSRTCRPRSPAGPPKRPRASATARSTSSGRSCRLATSRSSCSATGPGPWSLWASATVRSSAATRSSSRSRRRPD